MITKEEFVRRYKIAEEHHKATMKFEEALGGFVIEDKLLTDYVQLLMAEVGGTEGDFWDMMFEGKIEYWIFDDPTTRKIINKKSAHYITSAEELYDYYIPPKEWDEDLSKLKIESEAY